MDAGTDGVKEWNRRRQDRETIPSHRDAYLRSANPFLCHVRQFRSHGGKLVNFDRWQQRKTTTRELTLMDNLMIRPVKENEIEDSRTLVASNCDAHTTRIIELFPIYFDVCLALDPCRIYGARQRHLLGAFDRVQMVGTVAIAYTTPPNLPELTEEEWEIVHSRFSEQELEQFKILRTAFAKTFISAPEDSLTIHSLSVKKEYRGKGIAKRMLVQAISELNGEELSVLYVEIARITWLQKLFESIGFRAIRRTLSISERLRFGCWGSVLMHYSPENTGQK